MSAPLIVFLDEDTISDIDSRAALREAAARLGYGYRAWPTSAAEEIPGRIDGARVVITNKCRLGRMEIGGDRAPELKLALLTATGHDNIDLATAAEAGVIVANVRDYASAAVAEHALAMMLELSHRLRANHAHCRQGRWTASPHFCLFDDSPRPLAELTVAIVGHGAVGSRLAKALEALGAKVQLAARGNSDHREGRVPLADLLGYVDVISLHCPLNRQTRNLIGGAELAQMRPTDILINTARGGLVDEWALAKALDQGAIGGAGLDTLESEPPAADSPLLHCRDDRLLLSPHIAWASAGSQRRLIEGVIRNLEEFSAGKTVANALR